MTGRFSFDGETGRMIITDRDDENDDLQLHCGNTFQIEIEDKWHDVRIEHSGRWYLIGLPLHFHNAAQRYIGRPARTYV